MKKQSPGDIVLHMCTKNDDYMMYGSWGLVRDRRVGRWMKKVTPRDGCPT